MALPPLALSLPLPGVDTRTGVELARRAGELGYRGVWAAEVQGPDAFTQLAALAVTTDLDLGVAVVPVQTRSPFVLGMTALTLAELSGGRFTLGVGASSEVIVERWAGRPFDRPLQEVRETVAALRPMLRGERTNVAGERVTVDGYRPHTVPATPVPLYLGALNPRSLEMVGEVGADGLCLNQVTTEHVPVMLDEVRRGSGGDLPADFGVVCRFFCGVTDDVPAAREVVRQVFAPYVATSVYNRFYRSMGFEEEAAAVLAAEDRQARAAALSDELIDAVFCLGSADEVAARLATYVDAGVTVPVISPLSVGAEQATAMLARIAAAWES